MLFLALRAVTRSPSLTQVYPPYLSSWHFKVQAFASSTKTRTGPLLCSSPYGFCTHTSLKRPFPHAFHACSGSPSSTTSNSNANYLFFTFKTLQSPALPYLSITIQCWAIRPHFCLSYTRLPCQLVQSLPSSIFVLTYILHTLQKWEILLRTPRPASSPLRKACRGDSSGLRHPRSVWQCVSSQCAAAAALCAEQPPGSYLLLPHSSA